MSASSL
ncbi:hypothetical protein CgunFtcFv8_018140 [Champsocephalus gunnari]|nr:hypothetical protein CgunFtcFv8_018140 [Champsocephalus gunnari]